MITIDAMGSKWIMREYYKQHSAHKEMNDFLRQTDQKIIWINLIC